MNLMGIDMGTTSVKTAVFNEKLEQQMQTTADYTLESKGDRVEFEAEKYCYSRLHKGYRRKCFFIVQRS